MYVYLPVVVAYQDGREEPLVGDAFAAHVHGGFIFLRMVRLDVVAPGYLPADVSFPATLSLEPAQHQGVLLVVGRTGDEVQVNGRTLPLGAEEVALVNSPEGPLDVLVVGGGRRVQRQVVVSEGHATWERAWDSSPLMIRFGMNRSDLDARQRQALTTMAANAGSWKFKVQGSYSPEGDVAANQVLAQRRAETVAATLQGLGIAQERIEIVPAEAPMKDAFENLRYATVTPVSP